MAVQQNKKSPSQRGMHRAHDHLTAPGARGRADHGRDAPAPPHQPDRLLPRQEGRQDQGRVVALITVAVDCMGGDHGPHVTVPAALDIPARAARRRARPGRPARPIEARARARAAPRAGARLRVQHASEVVAMDEPPAQALRSKKDSSMRVAINLVKSGEAHACVSAGNTGALMAISRFVLKTLPGIDRPAIATRAARHARAATPTCSTSAPTSTAPPSSCCSSASWARRWSPRSTHKERPTVGLLNIGEEDIKGNES